MEENRTETEGFTQKRFIPELGKLPWFLKIPLFFVAIFLISMPYILMQQKNPFNQSVAAYDQLCKYKQDRNLSAIGEMVSPRWSGTTKELQTCVDTLQCVKRRNGWKLFIREDEDQGYTLMLKGHNRAVMVRFDLNGGRMLWIPK